MLENFPTKGKNPTFSFACEYHKRKNYENEK